MTKWEYFTAPLLEHSLQEILNNFGDEGWELVAVVAFSPQQQVGYFKRPKGE